MRLSKAVLSAANSDTDSSILKTTDILGAINSTIVLGTHNIGITYIKGRVDFKTENSTWSATESATKETSNALK
jgi:hypothetical protein